MLLFDPWLREERLKERNGLLNSNYRDKNLLLSPIYAIKIRDFYVKLFHLTRKVYIKYFCILKVQEKLDLSSGWFFGIFF